MSVYDEAKFKEWTILIYADGNNNLQPYIYNQFQLIKNINKDNINIIVQISRKSIDKDVSWCGCRRYLFSENKIILLKDLGKVNMDESKLLEDFLVESVNTYPSTNVILVISGHSAGFIGLMYSENDNAFMGIDEFSKALCLFNNKTNRYIDVLIMDTCFMDSIETWYDIIMKSKSSIRYAIVPQDNAPIEGISYYDMINSLLMYQNPIINHQYIKEMMSKQLLECSLFCINLREDIFKRIRKSINEYAQLLLLENKKSRDRTLRLCCIDSVNDFIPLYDFNNIDTCNSDVKECIFDIMKILGEIIIFNQYNSGQTNRRGLKIYFPHNYEIYNNFRNIYRQMDFCVNNNWTLLIDDKYI
ncbi:hypothetical protein SH1V18_21780 [Vallitalea longa]|uniref:Uncharacterized protein n=1 Tax=Vallitalea longa TaxID=2936439 RepID=A0A9W5YEF3_9FIRM|nr:clostripain-related cysteine peptidase [Vallitalea longa]GKX29698.1 hypothetical protein SH1V18_21780 [Vallitalea longa]